jgi:hypothetical protein
LWPFGVEAADQERSIERPFHELDTIEAIFKDTLGEKAFGADVRGAIAAERSQLHGEQFGHGVACASRCCGRQGSMTSATHLQSTGVLIIRSRVVKPSHLMR